LKLFYTMVLLIPGFAAIVLALGQLGAFEGSPPAPLPVDDRSPTTTLAPPSLTPNSVSSQAQLYPSHPQAAYAAIEPLHLPADETGAQAMARLIALLESTPGITVTAHQGNHVRAQAKTRWLGFVDDMDFVLDEPARVIQVRSASRLGRRDFGTNRQRLEALRQAFDQR
jgi:uncharacterized protein (DUF1499 family)